VEGARAQGLQPGLALFDVRVWGGSSAKQNRLSKRQYDASRLPCRC